MKLIVRDKDHQLFLKPILPGLKQLERMGIKEENIEVPGPNGTGHMIILVS